MMMFTQRISIMVNGSGYPRSGAARTRMQMLKLMVRLEDEEALDVLGTATGPTRLRS